MFAGRLALCSLLLAAACGDNLSPDDAALDPPGETAVPHAPHPGDDGMSRAAQVGKLLFEDTTLSEPHGEACATCHDPSRAFTGDNHSPVAGVAQGAEHGVVGTRNTPTAMYAMFSPPLVFDQETDPDGTVEITPTGGQFWDGRADTLAEQAQGPLLNPREMNNPSAHAVVAKVRRARYASRFAEVYGRDIFNDDTRAFDAIADAIGAYESTRVFRPFTSRFDAYLRGEGKLTTDELAGFALFKDPEKGNCISCHAGDETSRDPEKWLFTDHTYDNLGVPRNRAIPDNADPTHFDLGLCAAPGFADRVPAGFDVGSVCGAFKVPSLRNVAVTAPYMHNGRFTNLHDVVKFYVTRDTNPELWYPTGEKFDDLPDAYKQNVNQDEVPYDRLPGEAPRLDDHEIDQVVAFLGTLTDRPERP